LHLYHDRLMCRNWEKYQFWYIQVRQPLERLG
jgi:hypothetical protein